MAGTGSRKMGNAKAPSPTRHSTNKRVAVGSKNTTSAKTVKATVTPKAAARQAAVGKAVIAASKGTAYRNLARESATKKGGMPVYDAEAASRLRLSKKYPRSNLT